MPGNPAVKKNWIYNKLTELIRTGKIEEEHKIKIECEEDIDTGEGECNLVLEGFPEYKEFIEMQQKEELEKELKKPYGHRFRPPDPSRYRKKRDI